ncbi:MAG: response regulator, partial [Burkholderiales bacterium]|nr:response regulator [Burkholderiales bacterium]
HTTEIQAIERAVNTLVTTMHDNRQMNRNLQESERLLKREMLNAQQAARAKSDFISNISHEIRTPLSTMAGMLYLLEKSGLTPAQLTRLVLLRQCSNHLNDLITKVLDLSKIEAGMLKLESQVFLFGDVLDESFSLFAVEAAGKKLSYSMQVPADVGSLMLRGDALRIRQIFMNLLSNAIKFTAQGAVVLRAEQLAQASRQVCLKVSVADTGIGLAASDMTQLFQNFSQVDSSTRRQQGGSGLGLAISSKLAELMSGDMGVSSTMGSGAEFWVTFWLERADSADANSRQQTGVWTQGDAPQTSHVAQQAIPHAEPSDTHKGVVAHLAWLAHKDDPGAVTWLQAHQGVLAEALGQAWPAIQQALETYRLSDAVTLLSQAGISPVPSGEGNDDDDRPTLMLVDDTPGNISYLSGLLGDVCQLCVATTGQRAIELLRGNVQPALVLLDIAMPEQDGFSTLKAVKSDAVLAGTPVMLISASVTLQTVEKATQLGALDLIDRILPPQHLRERVITALQSTVESV